MATDEELKKVTGFFVEIGSRDLPFNYPHEDKFGFDEDNDIPVFSYSLKETMEGMDDPVVLQRPSVRNPLSISYLVGEGLNNPGLKKQEITSEEWENIYKILEFVANYQATIRNTKQWEDTMTYPTFPDYVFRTSKLPSETYPEEMNCYVSTYVPRSFFSQNSTKSDRIEFIEFTCNLNNVPKAFKIYYDIDKFMAANAGSKFFVYYYKDDNNDNQISQSEFDNNIIGELNKGIMDKIWKSTKQYFTPYCEPIHAEDGRITHKPAVNRTFYVYSNLPEELFTTEVMLDQIRQQLIKDNGGVEDDLSNQYPNLFSDQEVYIYPIHDNTAIDTREGDSIKIVHPFDYNRIQETMKRFGLPIVTTADNYRQIEMFYVGIDTLDLNILNKYIYPLLAADYSVNKLSKPITSRFINYSPRTFTNYDGTGSEDDKFQFILLQILGYFEKSIEEEDLKTSLKRLDPNLELEIFTNEEYSEPRVTFKMRNTKFIVVWYTSMNS